jgi:hypothetical protein
MALLSQDKHKNKKRVRNVNLEKRYESIKNIAISRTATSAQPAKVYSMMLCKETRLLMNLLQGFGVITTLLALLTISTHPWLALVSLPISISVIWFSMGQADQILEVMAKLKSDTDFK